MSKSNKYALITGCDGLIGSEAVKFFSNKNYKIIGIDNNSRKKFFGEEASVLGNRKQLKNEIKNLYQRCKEVDMYKFAHLCLSKKQ